MSRFFKDREKVLISENVSQNKRRIARIQSIDQKTRKGFIPDTLEKMDNLFAEVDILFMFPQVNLAFANANVALNVLNTQEQIVANKIAAHQIYTRDFNINNLNKRKGFGNLSPSEKKTYETGRFRINRFLILLMLGILLLFACQNTVGTPLVDNRPTATQVSAVEPTPVAAPEAITVEAVTSEGGGGVTPPKQEAIGTRIPNEIIINAARVINVTLTPEDLDKFANVDQTSRKVMYRMASSDAGDNNVQIVMETTVNGAKFFLIPVEDVVSVQASNNGVSIVDGNGNVIGDIDFITQVYKPTPVPEAAPEAPESGEVVVLSEQERMSQVLQEIVGYSELDLTFFDRTLVYPDENKNLRTYGTVPLTVIVQHVSQNAFSALVPQIDGQLALIDAATAKVYQDAIQTFLAGVNKQGIVAIVDANQLDPLKNALDENGNPLAQFKITQIKEVDGRSPIVHILPIESSDGSLVPLVENVVVILTSQRPKDFTGTEVIMWSSELGDFVGFSIFYDITTKTAYIVREEVINRFKRNIVRKETLNTAIADAIAKLAFGNDPTVWPPPRPLTTDQMSSNVLIQSLMTTIHGNGDPDGNGIVDNLRDYDNPYYGGNITLESTRIED